MGNGHTMHTGHWARRLLRRQRLAPFIPNFRTHFTLPRFPPALQTRQARAVRTSGPQRSFRCPRTRDSPSAFITRTLRGSFISHPRFSWDRPRGRRGRLPHALSIFQSFSRPLHAPLIPSQSPRDTPELDASFSVWHRPSKPSTVSFCDLRIWPPHRQNTWSS